MKTILFRLDYGENFGGGHLSRCLILAKDLQRKFKIIFIIQVKSKRNIYSCKKLILKNLHKKIQIFFLKNLNFNNELKLHKKLNVKFKISKIIFDFANIEKTKLKSNLANYFDKLKKINKNIILIDSFAREALANKIKLNLSMLITPYIGAKKNKLYKTHYYGGNYFVIRAKKLKKRVIRKKVKNILISCGQSDHKKITSKVLKILCTKKELFKNIKIKVVIGNDFKKDYINELVKIKKDKFKNFNIYFIKNCFNLSEYIASADICLISTGLTKYECIFYKSLPIIISFDNLSDNQQKKFQLYRSSIYLGQIRYLNKDNLIYNIKNLIKKYNLRKNIINNGSKIFDGRGTKRLIKILSYEK